MARADADAGRRRSGGRSARLSNALGRSLALIVILPFAFGGANSAMLTAATAILQLGWAALALALVPSDGRLVVRMAPVALPLILLLGWTALPFRPELAPWLVSPPVAPDLLGVAWCHAFSLVALLVGCATAARLPGFRRTTATWLCLFAAALITATLALRAFGTPDLAERFVVDQRHHRFAGLIGNANAAGIFAGMLSLLFHGVAHKQWRDWQIRVRRDVPIGAMIAVVGMIVTLVLVALSQSRTALAATLIAQCVCALGILSRRTRQATPSRWSIAALMVVIASAAALWVSAGAVLDRYGALGQGGSSRIAILRHYVALARQAPLTGYGLGAFDTVNQHHLTPDTVLLVGDFGAAHNAPLQLAIEAGWPGLTLVALALGAALWQIARITADRDDRSDTTSRGMLLAVAVAATGSMVDIALNVPAIAALSATLFGIVWGRSLRESAAYPARHIAYPNPWPTAAIRSANATPAGVSPSNRVIAPR